MGFPPDVVRGMSLSDMQHCVDGWLKANGAGPDASKRSDLSQDERESLQALIDADARGGG